MGQDIGRRYCKECKKMVKVESKGSSHILHLLLSIITCGLWIPLWFLCAMSRDWRCAECGSRKTQSEFWANLVNEAKG
jgi:hypothetical protein